MAYEITGATRPPVVFGATGMEEIEQNIRFILATMVFSVPLDRSFGGTGDFVDKPSPFDAQRSMASIVEIVERYEPRVKVTGITFTDQGATALMDGQLAPVLQFMLRDGVTL